MNTATSTRSAPVVAPAHASFDVARIRADFPILAQQVNDKPLVYLDNAASSQMPRQVIERWVRYHSSEHANIHRVRLRGTSPRRRAPQD